MVPGGLRDAVTAALLLDKLDRVSAVGTDRWRAICPAHESRNRTQTLAVRELTDGTVLIRCHAGCGAAEVVGAIGLQLGDLFPRDHRAPADARKAGRQGHWHAAREALQTLRTEVLIVALAAERVLGGEALSDVDRDRVLQAASLIRGAAEHCR